jgi:Domain of Unknown Function (DUF1080)
VDAVNARATRLCALCVVGIVGCSGGKPAAATDAAKVATNATSDTVGFKPMFDARLTQWRAWKGDTAWGAWVVTDSMISKDSVVRDLTTRAGYANFELAFDWKAGPMANAGVFYRVTDEYDRPYWSGPEYQLRDEAMDPKQENLKLASASVYGLYAPPGAMTKPLGEWNSARIVVNGNAVQHWLNGQQVVTYELSSPDFMTRVKAGKFGEYPNFGRAARGFIAIQGDHNGSLGIRNMRIRELP